MMPQQGRQATVGDTVTVVHRIAAPAGAVVQARAPEDSSIATLVGSPLVTREGDSVRIAYTLAVWAPGRNDLVLPGAVVIAMNGKIDTLPNAHVALNVASLLPGGTPTARIAPRPGNPWVPRADLTVLPFAILVPLALLIVAALAWRWRRRGRPPEAEAVAPRPLIDRERLDRWLAAGEARLALDHLESLTRDRTELSDWRARVDAVRFAPSSEGELAALVSEGAGLAGMNS